MDQRYIGPSNWKFLTRIKRHAGSGTILGSGDLFTAKAVRRMMNETGVDGVTLARSSIGNPFIFRECQAQLDGRELSPPRVGEQRDAIEFQFAESLALYGQADVGRMFRKFGIAYADLHPMRENVRETFIGATIQNAVLKVVARWYGTSQEWPEFRPRQTLRDLVGAGARRQARDRVELRHE